MKTQEDKQDFRRIHGMSEYTSFVNRPPQILTPQGGVNPPQQNFQHQHVAQNVHYQQQGDRRWENQEMRNIGMQTQKWMSPLLTPPSMIVTPPTPIHGIPSQGPRGSVPGPPSWGPPLPPAPPISQAYQSHQAPSHQFQTNHSNFGPPPVPVAPNRSVPTAPVSQTTISSPRGPIPAPVHPPAPNFSTSHRQLQGSSSRSDMAPQQKQLNATDMPSAIQMIEDDMLAKSGPFQTGYPFAEVPPLVTTNFFTEDQGNCSPRYMRATMYCAPISQDLLKQSDLPFGITVSPFAEPRTNELRPPIIDLGEKGPVRCNRCRAYICPFMEFQDGGRRFLCPFCKATSEVESEYFAHLDYQGKRTDLYQRPELYLGSYELVATKEYCKESINPKPPAYIFMLDVSYNAIRSGMVHLFCGRIRQLLQNLPKDPDQEESQIVVGFATYDQSVHFYNLKSTLMMPQMMIVRDVDDVFAPLANGFLVSPKEADCALENLLQEIPVMFGTSRITEIVLGPVIQAGIDALKAAERTGKLFVFHTTLPMMEAPGKLKNREDRKLLGTEKEKNVLSPVDDFYAGVAQNCVTAGCSVDMFLFPNSFIDVPTIGNLCGYTGGQLFKYPFFEAINDGERFLEDVKHSVSKNIGFDAVMRIRTSTGVRPTDFYGNIHMTNTTDIELASIDSDKAITVEIKHDDKIEPPALYIQAATLFTSVGGQRRLRIHNLALATTDNFANIYRSVELDTSVNLILKQAGTSFPESVVNKIATRELNPPSGLSPRTGLPSFLCEIPEDLALLKKNENQSKSGLSLETEKRKRKKLASPFDPNYQTLVDLCDSEIFGPTDETINTISPAKDGTTPLLSSNRDLPDHPFSSQSYDSSS